MLLSQRQSASGAVDVVYLSSAGDYSDQETSALMKWAEANGAWIFMEGQTRYAGIGYHLQFLCLHWLSHVSLNKAC